ncbi:MAG: deoxynucleoside kinase [Granulosicoccus sp.]
MNSKLTDMKHRFIAIEGPIGVGKTTLAKKLASCFDAEFLSDTELANPYLKAFYRDPKSVALHTQMHFLVSRLAVLDAGRLASVSGNDDNRKPVVADFLIDKDRLFAELTLDEHEWWMYNKLTEKLVQGLPQPDLVIYLQAPLERLIERIERRGLRHEQRIDSHYLQQVIGLYERHFHSYNSSPLLIVNADEINLADSTDDVAHLAERIGELPGGRHYYNPVAAA